MERDLFLRDWTPRIFHSILISFSIQFWFWSNLKLNTSKTLLKRIMCPHCYFVLLRFFLCTKYEEALYTNIFIKSLQWIINVLTIIKVKIFQMISLRMHMFFRRIIALFRKSNLWNSQIILMLRNFETQKLLNGMFLFSSTLTFSMIRALFPRFNSSKRTWVNVGSFSGNHVQ